MKNSIIAGVIMLASTGLFSQVGINGGYSNFAVSEWMELMNVVTGKNFENATGYKVGVDYWLRLKQRRIEFLPELGYASLKASSVGSEANFKLAGLYFNTNIYPFDFEGDCDCPTWSKSGGVFEKGFFIQVTPGITMATIKVNDELTISDETVTYLLIGVGAGVDLGISENITITPMIKYSISQKTEYLPSTNSLIDFGPVSANAKQLILGVRVGLNLGR